MLGLEKYSELLQENLAQVITVKEPIQLYEPISYIVSLGGKRLRPILTLMACDFFGGDPKKATNAAMAVELFHNFSLIHDDIMDDAPLRRGEQTVHEKWDVNTGILSGDAMLILAYQLFEEYEPELFRQLAKLFSKTAIEVCEGQQYDVDFETRDDVTIPEYLKMIDYKTAVLIGAAMQMGAIVANASQSCKEYIYQFGRNLGIAFQLQDDYLDAFGDPKTFGKQVGGDIITNKKTYLYLTALEKGTSQDKETLEQLYSITPKNSEDKIETIKELFVSTGSAKDTLNAIKDYTKTAFDLLEKIKISEEKKEQLRDFGNWLMKRKV
ncbi:polyprenyl synthetase family protein [Patiriisocius hiemis]|uniref:Polyprenyl synthetase family protein n=1 Tax=Patiriisocius hiemis TaxID=3075604 RepID=A0ABU2YBC4_9FLAO|nr:polyprenyl synthetase family protein [Constantimarinum sp. W242]MDT0555312.1 polyprenyl synthetase family protein [Constantimarinum sp. W242]